MPEKTVKAGVLGAAGRMGQRIISLIAKTEGITLGGAVERKEHPFLGQEIQSYTGINGLTVRLTDDLKSILPGIDVIIDFTDVKTTLFNIEAIVAQQIPVVIGTTGFSPSESKQLKKKIVGIPSVFSPNMSIGVNLMFKVVDEVARVLKDEFDVEIIEAHHRLKKDAPSGTAVRLSQIVAESIKQDLGKMGVYGRKGIVGERRPGEIGVHAVRAGDIVGEHTVLFAGQGERFEITHRAHSRDTFAGGAVRAALWIAEQPPGSYSMEDVLGI